MAIEVGELSDGQEKGENKKSGGTGRFLWLFLWLLGFIQIFCIYFLLI